MEAGTGTRRPRAKVAFRGAGVLVALVVAAGAVAVEAAAWRDALVRDGRALPGTVLAGTEVGVPPGGEVHSVAGQAADELLDRRVTVVHDDRRWRVTARELGATTDAREAADAALEATAAAPLVRVAAVRWLGRGHHDARDVRLAVPEARVAGLVEDIAAEVDREPVDAAVSWGGGGVELQAGERGARVDREATAAALAAALVGHGGRVVHAEVAGTQPERTTALLADVLPAVRGAVDGALDRVVTVHHGERTWEVTPRELGAVPDPQALVDGVLAAGRTPATVAARTPSPGFAPAAGITREGVPLEAPDAALDDLVAGIAADVDRDPRDARIDHSSGWVELLHDEAGLAVDRERARERLRGAVAGGEDTVELPVEDVRAAVTADAYHHVLLVRQDQRRLYLYVDGEIAREWPVAIGAPGSATPTGRFTVGAMRDSPTWYNPAPDGWGEDMPEVIEPGPTNPLGLRAMNWERDGRDTLIRFHGTSETWSIGQAASRGCVRMTNGDVVELFDTVSPGTTIVSTWG